MTHIRGKVHFHRLVGQCLQVTRPELVRSDDAFGEQSVINAKI